MTLKLRSLKTVRSCSRAPAFSKNILKHGYILENGRVVLDGEVAKMRLVIGEEGSLDASTLRCETTQVTDALAEKVAAAFHAECKVWATVELVAPGELPNDGKLIDDVRQYD